MPSTNPKDPKFMCAYCGRFFHTEEELYDSGCREVDNSQGMYHCRDCGVMVLGGYPHPRVCLRCLAELSEEE